MVDSTQQFVKNGLDTLASQNEIEVGAGKGIKPALPFDNDIFRLRLEDIDDCGTPRPLAKGFVVGSGVFIPTR
jgi:hypothetical protein